MKNALIILFATTTLALGVVCVVQWQKRDTQQTEILSLRGDLDQKAREAADLQAAQELLVKQRREALGQASDLAAKLQTERLASAALAARATPAPTEDEGRKPRKGPGAFSEFFKKMMDDPDTRKMIRQTQRMMLDQLYDPLIKQMGLTPEEADQFKDLLADNMMKASERATSMFGGGMTNRTELLAAMTAEQKTFDEQLRQFLGDARYTQYKDYQETVGERTQLNQLRQQFGTENALTDQQTEQLLQFMREERRSVTATGMPTPGAGHDAANLEAMMSGEGVEQLLQSQETVNQRVYDRARGVLSEEQLAAFGRFQTNQLQMMRMGMNMARRFMGAENSGGSAPSSP